MVLLLLMHEFFPTFFPQFGNMIIYDKSLTPSSLILVQSVILIFPIFELTVMSVLTKK